MPEHAVSSSFYSISDYYCHIRETTHRNEDCKLCHSTRTCLDLTEWASEHEGSWEMRGKQIRKKESKSFTTALQLVYINLLLLLLITWWQHFRHPSWWPQGGIHWCVKQKTVINYAFFNATGQGTKANHWYYTVPKHNFNISPSSIMKQKRQKCQKFYQGCDTYK